MIDTSAARKVAAVRRARFAAQVVFLSMAGTTMTFQVYHAIHYGHMPAWLAFPFGIVPLLIAIGVLEFVAEWEDPPKWAKPGAYLIVAGAMLLSATSTGDVVLKAAPPDLSWLFGVLLDGAAVLAVTYILHGPKPAEILAKARAEQQEREEAENGERARLRRELAAAREQAEGERAELEARITVAARQHENELAELRRAITEERDRAAEDRQALEDALRREHSETEVALRRQLEEADAARTESEQRAANAEANIADLTRRLEANAGANARANRTANGSANRGAKPGRKKSESQVPGDLAARAQALQIWTANPGISGAELGRLCGKTPRWGQLRIKEFEGHASGPDDTRRTEDQPEESQ